MSGLPVSDDYRVISERYAHPHEVLYLRPVRGYLGLTVHGIARELHLCTHYLSAYELLRMMVPHSRMNQLTDYYILESEHRGLISHKAAARIDRDLNRLSALGQALKLTMSETELLRWRRVMCGLTNEQIGKLVGLSYQCVTKVTSGAAPTWQYELVKSALVKLEHRLLCETTYDVYH